MHAALELGDQVLLITAVIGREHHVLGRHVAVVGDVEEVAILLEQPHLPLVGRQSLAEDDHPIALLAGNRLIVELGDHLFEQMDRLEASLSDDLRLDPFGLLAGRCLDRVSRRSFQETVRFGRQLVGPGLEDVVGRISEDEADVPRIVPGIQVRGLGDRRAVPRQDLIVPRIQILVLGDPRVSPQQDLAEAGPNAQRDRLVQVLAGPLLRRAIAAAIEQVQGFAPYWPARPSSGW